MSKNTCNASNLSKAILWPEQSSFKQNFSLPSSIIYYISKNPSTPQQYFKFVQTCKYFYEKLPILIVQKIMDQNILSSCNTLEEHAQNNGRCCIRFDYDKLIAKIWILCDIGMEILEPPFDYIENLCTIMYQCECEIVKLCHQILSLNEMKLIAGKAIELDMTNTRVVHENSDIVLIAEILECLPKLKMFVCNCYLYDFNVDTVENIAKFLKKSQITSFQLYDIRNVQNVTIFWKIIKIKYIHYLKTFLSFHDDLLQQFKVQLDALCRKLFRNGNDNCLIVYHGQDNKLMDVMEDDYFDNPDIIDDSESDSEDEERSVTTIGTEEEMDLENSDEEIESINSGDEMDFDESDEEMEIEYLDF